MINRLALAALTIAATSPAWAQAKKANAIAVDDWWSVAKQAFDLAPKALAILVTLGTMYAVWLMLKAFWQQRRGLQAKDLALVVIALMMFAGSFKG